MLFCASRQVNERAGLPARCCGRDDHRWLPPHRTVRRAIFGEGSELMGRPSKMLAALVARVRSDETDHPFEELKAFSPEEEIKQLRSELRNGLTDLRRLFLFVQLS